MKICVLGGSGFIGTNLVRNLLAENHEVIIGDLVKSSKYPEHWKQCDICKLDEVRETIRGCDWVFNLAAEHQDNVRPIQKYYDVNVDGSEVVCQAATAEGIKKVVFTSSVAVFGLSETELDETSPTDPFNHYGISKLQGEAKFNEWKAADPTNQLIIIRPTVVFGEHNRGNFYNLLNQVVSGRFIMVGNGKNRKSVCYVENIAAFLTYLLSIEQPKDIYNYIDKPDMTMNHLVTHLRKLMGKSSGIGLRIPYPAGFAAGTCLDGISRLTGKTFPISAVRVKKFCSSSIFKADRVQESGFVAPFTLEDAISNTVKAEWPDLA